ncbi:hypothetical protein NECID01_2122 [Nematocida sp. AWRm77]|nr:hypothetical protein NECID01_2122 [Nematocida sp. AWRm77]
MRKIPSRILTIFVALSSVHSTQVSANFILKDGTAVFDTVSKEAFKTLENQDKYRKIMQKTLHGPKPNKRAGCVTIILPELRKKVAYGRFKSLWSTDSAPGTEEREESSAASSYFMDITAAYAHFKRQWNNAAPLHFMHITPEEFLDFMLAANYLDIRGEYAKRFAQNMVKYGLFGIHSADIMASKAFSTYNLPQKTFQDLLHAFLRQIDFAYRTIIHPSTGQTLLRIEKADARPKQINKEYTGPSQTTRMRTVLYTELGPESSPERERNEAVLVWLLLNIGGSSVDIQYTTEIIILEDITDLSQTIYNLTKENEQGGCVYVEGLALKVDCRNSFILRLALQLVPGLLRLELSIASIYSTPPQN